MTTHTDCQHPATKAARAACRKARQGDAPAAPRVAVAKAQAETAPAPRIAKIEWERATCTRCAGSGRYPSSMWQGVCLGCNGHGQMLTRAGRAALKKYDAYLAKHHSKMMIELQPGDVVRDNRGARRTVVSVDTEIRRSGTTTIGVPGSESEISYCSLGITVNYKKVSYQGVGAYDTIVVPPRGEALQAAFRHVANMKGCIVTLAE